MNSPLDSQLSIFIDKESKDGIHCSLYTHIYIPAALMMQAGELQVLVDGVGFAVVECLDLPVAGCVVVFGDRLVAGFVSFACCFVDVLPSLLDLFLSTAYSEMNTTLRTSSTTNNTMTAKRTFEGLRVSGSSNKLKGVSAMFS
jgi:hypothetical protein